MNRRDLLQAGLSVLVGALLGPPLLATAGGPARADLEFISAMAAYARGRAPRYRTATEMHIVEAAIAAARRLRRQKKG